MFKSRIRKTAFRIFSLSYFLLLLLVVIYFESNVILDSILFIIVNYSITVVFIKFEQLSSDKLFFYLIYSVYFIGYIFKGVILNVGELNSHYIYSTIRVVITPNDYVSALDIVTIGHIILLCLFFFTSILPSSQFKSLEKKKYISNNRINLILIFILIWILFSSIIMRSFGVAVMGAEGVSLPYKLSGIFFYSRTLIIPILLLYFLEKSVVRRDKALFNKTMILYLFLVVSEIIIRASKEPLLNMVLFMSILFYLLLMHSIDTQKFINKKKVIITFVVAVSAFPIISAYRSVLVNADFEISQYIVAMGEFLSNTSINENSYITEAIVHFFHRLIGFTQMTGIISMQHVDAHYMDVFEYGSIANYYTKEILGYHIDGHASSPSLIGAALILGGETWWLVPFLLYLSFMIVVWRFSNRFVSLGLAVKCLLGYEVFNTMIAGTFDASLYRMTIVFIFVLIFEARILSTSVRQRH